MPKFVKLSDFLKQTKGQPIYSLDIGKYKTGVAVAYNLKIAFPLEIIKTSDLSHTIKTQNVKNSIIGLSINKIGNPNPVYHFIEGLIQSELSNINIMLWDERYTTQIATRAMHTPKSRKPKKPHQALDAIAACYLLQSFLDRASNINQQPYELNSYNRQ